MRGFPGPGLQARPGTEYRAPATGHAPGAGPATWAGGKSFCAGGSFCVIEMQCPGINLYRHRNGCPQESHSQGQNFSLGDLFLVRGRVQAAPPLHPGGVAAGAPVVPNVVLHSPGERRRCPKPANVPPPTPGLGGPAPSVRTALPPLWGGKKGMKLG